MRSWWLRAMPAWVLLCPQVAWSQYRNSAFFLEGGAQSLEVLPWTAAAVAGTEGGRRAQKRLMAAGKLPSQMPAIPSCMGVLQNRTQTWPCRQDYFGTTDAPYLGLGYQRVVGDLLLDLSENPVVENLVVTVRVGVAPTWSLPTMHTVPRPMAFFSQEMGLRWNIWDEKLRPFVGVSGGFSTRVDPLGTALAVKNMGATCRRAQRGEDLAWDEVCVQDSSVAVPTPAGGGAGVDSNWAWFSSVQAPLFFSARPEVGVEYFFMEDISVQGHASAGWMASPVPAVWLNRPPYVGAPNGRLSVSLAAYW